MPASLETLLSTSNAALVEEMADVLDLEVSREAWADATAAGVNCGLDLSGVNQVQRFATQSNGSFYGLVVGDGEQTGTSLEACPVVYVSCAETARVAQNLHRFWCIAIALNRFSTNAVESVNDNDRAKVKQRLARWRAMQEDDESVTLCELRNLTGPSEVDLTDDKAIDALFDCNSAETRFRPR